LRWSAAQALAWIMRQKPLELREWKSDMGPELRPAEKALGKALGDGRVNAWGRPSPHALTEQVPSDPFRILNPAIVVGPHGDMKTLRDHQAFPEDCPRWHLIALEADEIKREWPKTPPPSAIDWMLMEAERLRGLGKRGVMVQDCMIVTNCSKRDAEAAHKALPEGMRRKRGKPPKNAG